MKSRCTIDPRVADQYISTSGYSITERFEELRRFRASQPKNDLSFMPLRYSNEFAPEPEQEISEPVKRSKRKRYDVE